jgi:hypothetical protein
MITEIRATSHDKSGMVKLEINTRCESIKKLAGDLLRMAAKHCKHTSCPVPSGIVKAVEVASGMALPKDASIKVMQEKD